MSKNQPEKVEIGNTVFVQACARMMSAAWIRKQIIETSTAPGLDVSGIAYSMRYTVASDIGMAFELALKSVAQGLSPNQDGEKQVLKSHDLPSHLWREIPCPIRAQIDRGAESAVCRTFGDQHRGKVLPFAEYVEKHAEFLNRTVGNRYAIPGQAQWKSDHRLVMNRWLYIADNFYKGKRRVDGIGVLLAYWWAIMETALDLRWEDKRCKLDEALAADREEARNLVKRAVEQMLERPRKSPVKDGAGETVESPSASHVSGLPTPPSVRGAAEIG